MTLSLVLWLAGLAVLAVAAWRIRAPFARMRELDQLADNARRYESWRGGSSRTAAGRERTGADEMREMLRRQVYLWAAAGAAAIVLVIAGFIVR